jgi:hypothetical protein
MEKYNELPEKNEMKKQLLFNEAGKILYNTVGTIIGAGK